MSKNFGMGEIWQVSTKIVYQNKWTTVREDQIKRQSGSTGLYGVVDKPHFVVIVPFNDGKVHLVQQYRYPVKDRYWEFPQGSWEQEPDIDPELLAIGELREETGIVASKMVHIGFQYVGYGYSSQGYHIYFATGLKKKDMRLEMGEEGLITSEFTVTEFEKMLLDGKIKDASTTAAYCMVKMKNLI